ncbi:MAG: M23 family metallopeptidase [Candidatus Hodarchaeota archaeon]
MKIEYYPKKNIIKTSRSAYFGEEKVINFTIKAIKIKNIFNSQIKLNALEYELKEGDQVVQTIGYYGSALEKKIEQFKRFAERFLKKKEGFGEGLRIGNLQKMFGTEQIWNENQLSLSIVLLPQEETGIISEQVIIFGKYTIDHITIKVKYSNHNETETCEITIPISEYQVKNEYIFPVKGAWHVTGSFDDCITGHRIMYSQEFAFDLDKLFESSPLPQNRENIEYPCYREKIYAVAGGEVVQVYSDIPENPTAGSDLTLDDLKTLWEKFGYEPLGPGNFIAIKHSDSEYSFYAHLIPDSIQVNIGDIVEQGEFLGLVGNSGNSEGPHLHFQLMNGPSTQTGRALPCTFTNLYDCYGNKISYPSMTSQIVFAK